ncbi:MAG: nucleotidyltransferase [Sphingobacteriaceae bacterium]|nr:MAG: nucleotidyltransferase [Sphingobacteriaceae bacterium]
MVSQAEIEQKLKAIKPILSEQFYVSEIGYFGSYATKQQNDQSDLDLLVTFSKPVGWSFFTLENFLEKTLGIPIDLVTRDALKQQIKTEILKQVIYI